MNRNFSRTTGARVQYCTSIAIIYLEHVKNMCQFTFNVDILMIFPAPYISCDMERDASSQTGGCRLFQDPRSNLPWTQNAGLTLSGQTSSRRVNGELYPVTGPPSAREGLYYIYIETSNQDPASLARPVSSATK